MDVIGISCGIACDISSVISFCSIVMLVIWLWKLKSEFAWSGRLPSKCGSVLDIFDITELGYNRLYKHDKQII
jgi:hypothetical protein